MSPKKFFVLPKKDEEFTDACRELALLSSSGSLTEENEDMIELMAECSNYFLRKLIRDATKNISNQEITYDEVAELVHSNERPWLAVLRESFRKRLSLGEIINRRKKVHKSQFFFDYTHFNKHNKEEGGGEEQKKQKEPSSTPKGEKRKSDSTTTETPKFSSKKRKITPKKRFGDE